MSRRPQDTGRGTRPAAVNTLGSRSLATDGRGKEQPAKRIKLDPGIAFLPVVDRPLNLEGHMEENGPAHHTDEFQSNVVVRRGQPFTLEMHFDRDFNKVTDKLKIELQYGNNPLPNKGTLIRMQAGDALKKGEWSAAVEKVKGQMVKVRITSPADAIIGRYHVIVETTSSDQSVRSVKSTSRSVVVLFNPWCKDDLTYLDDDAKLDEYVLNEHGILYFGNFSRIAQRGWNFGQFEPDILETCLLMMDMSGLSDHARRSAVSVSRSMSKMVNSLDDNGVLEANYSGQYAGGTPPVAWNGSVAILQEWYRERRPVKFGQCPVFAAVNNTVLRCLGIPARCITNYESGHDRDESLTVDFYFDEYYNPIDGLNEPIWHFHIWNEAWMARPDLPDSGYGGWQALDATPQETSDGVFQCGPSPVVAVKNGQVYLPYDTKFVFAEVNADKVHYRFTSDGYQEKLWIDKRAVGCNISTKQVGSNEREDITENYKYPEGSDQERVAVRSAVKHGSWPVLYDKEITGNDVEFSIHADEEILIGQDIHVTLTMNNKSSEPRVVTVHLTTNAMYYTGVPAAKIGELEKDVTIPPGGKESVKLTYTWKEYLDKLVEQAIIKVFVLAHVDTTKQVWAGHDDFRLTSPDLVIEGPSEMKVGQPSIVKVKFTNPLAVRLRQVEFRIEGPGLQRPKSILYPPIEPGQTVVLAESMTPARAGNKTIDASLTSDKLQQVTGELDVVVKK